MAKLARTARKFDVDDTQRTFYCGFLVAFLLMNGLPDVGEMPEDGGQTKAELRWAKKFNAKRRRVVKKAQRTSGLSAAKWKAYLGGAA